MKKFVFDTNILIDMNHYNPLVFKSLWENIYNMLEKNLIYSVPEVHDELYKADDVLNEKWEKIDEKYGFFVDLTDKTNSLEYIDAIKNLESFEIFQKCGEDKANWADPYLISAAMVDGSIVVTNETARHHPERKIPFVCSELGIPCMTFDDFMIDNDWCW